MGKNETASPKSEKTSSPVQGAPPVHAYPDWATMQAYYGHGVALSVPFFNAAHAPHPYMWRPQALMSPFGASYAAIYPHGGYSHPSIPGPHSHYQGLPPSSATGEATVMATPVNVDTPAKSSSSKERSLLKKLKGSDGLAVSVGNGMVANTTAGISDGNSQSVESGGEGSSDGSDGSDGSKGSRNQGKNSENMPLSGKDGNANALAAAPANVAGKPVVDSKPLRTADLRVSTGTEVKAGIAPVTPPATAMIHSRAGVPHELWIQDERGLKRERRKQSNRESARRSRLRKQAETEELALKVDTLTAENTQLRSEINRLIESSEKLKHENTSLVEKLQNALGNPSETLPPQDIEQDQVATENLLSKINSSLDTTSHHRGSSNSKLKQLLKSNSRDTLAAG